MGIRFFLETSNRYQCEFAPSYWYAYSYWIVLKIVNNYRVQSTMISIIDDCSCIISSGSSMTHYYFLPYFFSLFSIVEAVCDLENDGKWTVGDRRLWLRDWMCHKASLRPRCPSLNQLTWKKMIIWVSDLREKIFRWFFSMFIEFICIAVATETPIFVLVNVPRYSPSWQL